ncbi:MAG TPA: GlsB/YeaQ/YmgE family stress response membrane protein [Aggregatilineaceae bacterium]|nr:GlsB/YeaQ/YmgE family stress response membrane protein [Aggregatilineaceae bacterium]
MGDFFEALIEAPFICIGWIIVGALAGAAAHRIMKSKAPMLGDIVLGLAGAIVGGLIVGLLGLGKPDGGLGLMIVNWMIATLGAVLLIYAGRAMSGKKNT